MTASIFAGSAPDPAPARRPGTGRDVTRPAGTVNASWTKRLIYANPWQDGHAPPSACGSLVGAAGQSGERVRNDGPGQAGCRPGAVSGGQLVDPVGQGQDVGTFLPGDGDRTVGQGPGDLFQRQASTAAIDELVDDPGVAAGHPAFQADQQPVQPSGEVLVKAGVQRASLRSAGKKPSADLRITRQPTAAVTDPSASRPTFAARRRSKISTAHNGAPV
jgi:hypothetical protein